MSVNIAEFPEIPPLRCAVCLRDVRRGGRLCPPLGTLGFADGFRVSEAYFAGRAEASAPTSPLMLKVYFLEFM